jgi:hypothetical protein
MHEWVFLKASKLMHDVKSMHFNAQVHVLLPSITHHNKGI